MEPGTTREPTARTRAAQARRAQIVETALDLFARQGFDATTTKQIARVAGIAEGLIFHYFPTKADLLGSILETRHAFFGELRALLADAGDRTAREVLGALAAGWLGTLRREKTPTLVIFTTGQTNPEVARVLDAAIEEAAGRLTTYLAGRVAAGELRADLPVDPAARMFLFSLFTFFLKNRELPDALWDRNAESFRTGMLEIWLDGARPRSG
jgi:AcrR family transcriptional regulator